jgi:hypothetical protein
MKKPADPAKNKSVLAGCNLNTQKVGRYRPGEKATIG